MKYFVALLCCFLGIQVYAQDKPIGIGIPTPDQRALLHLESTDKALYLPRLTTSQRDAQTGWKAGMLIYNSTDSCLQKFNGLAWKCLGDLNLAQLDTMVWKLKGNTGTTATNFLGTTDNVSLRIRTRNIERAVVDSMGNMGIGIKVPKVPLHVNENASVLFGKDTLDYGNKLYWNAVKGALRAGGLNNTVPDGKNHWDNDSIGKWSMAFGRNVLASGLYSIAMGHGNRSTSDGAFTAGNGDTAAGAYSAAIGKSNFTGGSASFAAGAGNRTTASYGVALGQSNNAIGVVGIAAGYNNTAVQNAVALGFQNYSTGNTSISIGYLNKNDGLMSTTLIGKDDSATSDASSAVAIGNKIKLAGSYSIGIGYSNTISGYSAISIGSFTSNTYQGSLLLTDNSLNSITVASTAVNQFTGLFNGGYRFFTDRSNQIDQGMFITNNATAGKAQVGINIVAPKATLDVNGSIAAKTRVVNFPAGGTASLQSDDFFVLLQNSVTSFTLGGSGGAALLDGRIVVISNLTGSTVTLNGPFNFGSPASITIGTGQVAQFIWVGGFGWFRMN